MTQVADRDPTQPHEKALGFVNYQTYTQDILLAFASAILLDSPPTSLPASSNLALEVGNDGNVRAWLNDEEYTIVGCTPGSDCAVSTLRNILSSFAQESAMTVC